MRAALALLLLTACASAPPYAHCGGDVSCAMGTCTEVAFTRTDGTSARGNFCTSTCVADADCPDDGACIAFGHDPSRTFFCVKRCMTSTECFTPSSCTMLTADGTTFGACLP